MRLVWVQTVWVINSISYSNQFQEYFGTNSRSNRPGEWRNFWHRRVLKALTARTQSLGAFVPKLISEIRTMKNSCSCSRGLVVVWLFFVVVVINVWRCVYMVNWDFKVNSVCSESISIQKSRKELHVSPFQLNRSIVLKTYYFVV